MHLAAESHVDRSIDGPAQFIQTNVVGTFTLLEAALEHWRTLCAARRGTAFRFHHVSTDEVFGSLGPDGSFTEATPYEPNSPYSASKAASDHLVRAWHHTYGLPVVLTNCSNNYGPYHFPEKLIPLMILNALEGKPLPVYGKGENVRDWLYRRGPRARAHPHCGERAGSARATTSAATTSGPTSRSCARSARCWTSLRRTSGIGPREQLITFVADRPGHDLRYAIDARKIASELGWAPQETFESGLAQDRRMVSRQPRLVGTDPLRASTAASGSGWWRDPAVRRGGQLGQRARRIWPPARRLPLARCRRAKADVADRSGRRDAHCGSEPTGRWSSTPPPTPVDRPRARPTRPRGRTQSGPAILAEACATSAACRWSTSRPTTCSTAPRRALMSRRPDRAARRLRPQQGRGRGGDPRLASRST